MMFTQPDEKYISSRALMSASDLQRRSPNFPMNFLNGLGEEVELVDAADAKGKSYSTPKKWALKIA